MNKKQLDEILAQHKIWLNNNAEGKRADLREADLQEANLQRANLQEANLIMANLQGVDLQGANLLDANLRNAYLQGANLRKADLRKADLRGADLRNAYLLGANLLGANLRGADLQDSNLQEANLLGADLQGANLLVTDLQGVKNAKYAILDSNQKQLFGLTTSKDSELEQQAKENVLNKQKIEELEQKIAEQDNTESEKKELEKKLEVAQQKADEKDNIQKELDKLKKERGKKQEAALNTAIEKIENSTARTAKMLKHYNLQSWALIIIGLLFYLSAIVAGYSIWYGVEANEEVKNLYIFAPTFLLGFLGTALLRHDWKIRQLASNLNKQQSTTDTATGILKAALDLQSINDMPDFMLKEAFDDMKRALLTNNNQTKDTPTKDDVGLENMIIKAVEKSLKPKS